MILIEFMKKEYLSHTNINDINEENLYIKYGTLQMKHEIFKNHELIVKTSILKLAKYPVQTYEKFDPNNHNINLQFDMNQDYSFDNFYQFYKMCLKKFVIKNSIINNCLKLKLRRMEAWNYPVYEVKMIQTNDNNKPIIKVHKPKSKDDLCELFKPSYNVVAFVQFKILSNQYLIMKPTKIYVGKYIDEEIIEQITKYSVKQQVPTCEYYYPIQAAIDIDETVLAKLLES